LLNERIPTCKVFLAQLLKRELDGRPLLYHYSPKEREKLLGSEREKASSQAGEVLRGFKGGTGPILLSKGGEKEPYTGVIAALHRI